jgi:tetratricopeptide (TPR) repeat protein
MKKIVLIMSMLLVASAFLAAQDYKGKGRVAGYVYDEEGKPIEGVLVKLFSVKAGEGFNVKTDKDGKWQAAWIRSGGWNVDFEKIGYAPKKIAIDISESKKNPDVEIRLKKIEGLVITDEMKDFLAKGNELFDQKDYAGALAAYEQILEKYPDAYPIYRNIGNCYFSEEKYDLAEQNYMKVLEKNPEDAETILAIGNCYTNRGDAAKALEWYGKIDFEKLDDPVVLYNVGTIYYNNSKFDDALKYYQKAVEKNPDFADGYYQLGLTYLNLQKNPEAVAAFETCLKVLPPDSPKRAQVQGFLDYLKKK